ncbi:MAG: hypothetical protein V4555_00280 [Acidobacteriota bacterium]
MNLAAQGLSRRWSTAERTATALQFAVSTVATVGVLLLISYVAGPDAEGYVRPLRTQIEGIGLGVVLIAEFFGSAVLLRRRKMTGWYLGLTLDAMLTFVAASLVWTDLSRSLEQGAVNLRSGVAVHGPVLVLCLVTLMLLFLATPVRRAVKAASA